MRVARSLVVMLAFAGFAAAQLTMDQKINDFQYMASVYAKRYGPYEWKRDAIGFDLLNIAPWLDQVRKTKSDLEFYDVMSQYVASLNDAHDAYYVPSAFAARLNFTVDVFDGKLLVDTINRSRLPGAEFPFVIGYELVSIDGVDAQKLVDQFLRYEIAANARSTRRFAALLATTRLQQLMPFAADVPEISTVVFKRFDGKTESYRIPWTKSGLPLVNVGVFQTPQSAGTATSMAARTSRPHGPMHSTRGGVGSTDYLAALRPLLHSSVRPREVTGFGSLAPVFAASLPTDFSIRLGRTTGDYFYSGTFSSGGYKIGYIRIADYEPADTTAAATAFLREIVYFQANTDGLIVDDMRNPGGYGDYANLLLSMLMKDRWRSLGFEVRATSEWVEQISSALETAKASGYPDDIIALYQMIKDELVAANAKMRGRTNPIPLDSDQLVRDPLVDAKGNLLSYTKPILVLVDELSASAAEIFAATIQDNARGPLFGWRTMGAGGNVEDWEAGSYSQGTVSVTESLMNRKTDIVTKDYPAAPYVENIGVRPDIEYDYMTSANLLQSGKPFVDAMVAAMVDNIRKNK